MSDMRTQVGVWIIACFLAVVFNLPAQNATNCVFFLPDTADALKRLDLDKRWNASFRRNMEGDQDALLMARANNGAELQKFVSPGKSYVVLEWMGGFQSGYNVAVLTEQASIFRGQMFRVCVRHLHSLRLMPQRCFLSSKNRRIRSENIREDLPSFPPLTWRFCLPGSHWRNRPPIVWRPIFPDVRLEDIMGPQAC